MKADDFLDAPDAEDFLADAAPPVRKTTPKPIVLGRGNAPTRAPLRIESVLQQPAIADAFADAPDPGKNAAALFNALATNPELAKSPMYRTGAAVLDRAASGTPSAVESAVVTNDRNLRLRAQKDKRIAAARQETDEAFGQNPVVQAIAAPARRLASGAASVVGGAATIPQLFGSSVGRDTADAANLMASSHMPADPNIADEVLAGAGQVLPMIGGAAAIRAALIPLFGEAAATGVATTLSGATGGAMSGAEVLRDLEFRGDLTNEQKRQRALVASIVSGVSGKYADRLMLPGSEKTVSGPLHGGLRALFGEGAQEGLDQATQNLVTDRPLGEGVGHAALIGGLVGGGTHVAGNVSSDPYQLARAIDQDAQAFADRPIPQVVQQPVARAVAEPLPAPAVQPEPARATPALPYDPDVKASPDIMVAGQDGTARPMTADEFLQAEDTRQQGVDTGLTPDVRRAQENRSDVTDVEPKPTPDLLKRLIDSGWTPPENGRASRETIDSASATDQAPALPRAAAAPDTRADGADGPNRAGAGEPDAALTREPVAPPAAAAQPTEAANDATAQVADAQFSTIGEPIRAYRAGGERGLTHENGGPTFYATERRGAVPYAKGDEASIREETINPKSVFDTTRPAHRDLYEQFMKDTGHPARYGQRAHPFWTAEPELRKWLVKNGHNFDAVIFDENTGVPSYALYPDEQASKAAAAAPPPPLDHGELNIPGRTKNIDRDLDRYKAEQARTQKVEAKQRAAERRDAKVEARRQFDELWPAMRDKMGAKFGEKQLRDTLDSMVKWEPAKFLKMAEKFQREQAAESPAQDDQRSEQDVEQFRRGPERPDTSTAATIRAELRPRFGDVIDRLEKRGFLKLWDSVADYNAAGQYSQLPADASGGVQGMYSNKTGVAHLFGDGIQPGTAVGVLLHEVGEHASMKAMLGAERYRDLVRRAYRLASDGDEVAQTAMDRIPDDTPDKFYDSELLAYMIEETANRENASPAARSWLRDVVAAIRAWFYQTGFAKRLEGYGVKLELQPKDIAALAVRAVEWQAEQQDETQASGVEQPAFSKKPPVSATGSNPNTVNTAAQPWTVAEPGTWDNIVRQMQNNKVDLKRVRESIEERFGRIPDDADAYLNEELYHGKVASRVEKLHHEQVEPILRKIAVAGANHDVTLDDVNAYLHALHAPERNAAMAAINPTMPNNTALSGMSDADAAKTLADFQRAGKAPALAAIAKDVHQLLADTRTALVADGLEEASTVQAWEQAYKNYVPLMRDVEDRPAKGSGVSVKGPEAKRAVGSNKQAVNILANVVTQAETAAIRAEKAEVGRSLLAMAQAYPNADFWKVDTPPTKPRVNPNTGLVERSAVDPLYQTADNVVMVKDYGATRFIVFDKGNERAMALAKAMKNLDVQQVPRAIQYMGKATRFMASLLTQRNPEFWFTNFSRDLQGSMIQMSGTDAEGLQGKVMANLPKAMAGMRHIARDTGKQTQWARYAQEMQDAGGTTGYMQMFENSDQRMKDLQAEVDRMGQGKADPRRLARELVGFIDDYNDVIENGVRLAVFQATREAGVSTKRAASIAKNITVNFNRKGNATPLVNSLYMFFNAGVQGTARLAQALATSNKARVAVGSLAAVAFVMDIVNRALAGDDDETKRNRYDLIPEAEKSRNWIFMNPAKPGSYVKVPLPIGFNIFHNAGRLTADAIFRKDPRNAAEYGWAFASTLLDAFSPLGNFGSVGQLIAPTVLDPVVQLAENKSAFGGKVYKPAEQGFGKVDPKPAYTRYFDSTPDFWKAASKTLNDVTGGDKVKPGAANIEPDILRFIYTTMTGGPGRALDKSVDTAQASARGEKVSAGRLPFAGRFYGSNDDRQKDAAYYEDLKRAERAKTQFGYYNKAGRRDLALEVLKDLGQGDPAKGRQVIAEYDRAKKDDRVINRRLRQLAEQKDEGADVTEQTSALKERKRTGHKRVLSTTGGGDEE